MAARNGPISGTDGASACRNASPVATSTGQSALSDVLSQMALRWVFPAFLAIGHAHWLPVFLGFRPKFDRNGSHRKWELQWARGVPPTGLSLRKLKHRQRLQNHPISPVSGAIVGAASVCSSGSEALSRPRSFVEVLVRLEGGSSFSWTRPE